MAEETAERGENAYDWQSLMFLYNAAIKEVRTKLDIMVEHINDIAGVRIVCSFTSDIYRLAEMIGKQKEFTILYIKDYMKHPKESGYRSYHMLITVPIQTSNGIKPTKVEIQIRTIAMDFWASLEHKIYYKFEGNAPEYISRELKECADMVSALDDKMLSLNEAIQECLEKQEELNMSTKTKESNRQDQRVLQGLD